GHEVGPATATEYTGHGIHGIHGPRNTRNTRNTPGPRNTRSTRNRPGPHGTHEIRQGTRAERKTPGLKTGPTRAGLLGGLVYSVFSACSVAGAQRLRERRLV